LGSGREMHPLPGLEIVAVSRQNAVADWPRQGAQFLDVKRVLLPPMQLSLGT
jgi:hypothetical protein